ncbi:cellulose synthase-like protein G2 [Silene latifolia]|uniref:cellulose synthase-like protein G2 n=1 Tax=Silene latifolia TaxID=37657 RepID=UPI003D76A7F0
MNLRDKTSKPTINLTMESSNIQSLQQCHVLNFRATLNKIYSFSHFLALIAIFYYRGSFFFNKNDPKFYKIPILPWLIIIIAELSASTLWLLRQPILWRPVTRAALIERLPKDEKLPGIDVFICTADPKREPTIDVMNTVISAMALDYPTKKLSVYLSDDGGASVTLDGLKEAWEFATWWLPFVRRYNVQTICPRAYFELPQEVSQNLEFLEERKLVKEKFDNFEYRVRERMQKDEVDQSNATTSPYNHPALVQVVNETSVQKVALNPEQIDMPSLVYIAREKRPSQPHNFKAGALNVLLRVSSTMSNSPYILVLDCDMYCNGPTSARKAMCFHLDPSMSSSLGWVQFPHTFHNISDTDIYDSQMRSTWPILYPGMDGLQGPVLSGTNFFIKRQPFYGVHSSNDMKELKSFLGSSNEFIKSVSQIKKHDSMNGREISSVSLQEAHFLASCTYERDTKWGEKVGFRYKSVVEDVMTGLSLQHQGWTSVYLNPTRPDFLGSATTNLNDLLTQGSRWTAGLLQIGLSKHNPLSIIPSKMSIPQKMVCSWITLFPLDFVFTICCAILPPICFFYGIPLYPSVLDPLFIPFAFVFISSNAKHLLDVIFVSKGSLNSWLNEERIFMVKGVTCYFYGTLECVMSNLGIREAMFIPTNKANEEDTTKWYQMGKYDFRTPTMILIPLVTSVTLNLLCLLGGVTNMIVAGDWDKLFAQVCLSIFVLMMSFPIIDGMLLRKDNARVPYSISMMSTLLSMVILSIGYFIL